MSLVFAKRGKWFIVAIFAATIFSAVSVYAQTMENRPICTIEGTIQSAKFKDSIFSADLSVYLLSININSVSNEGGDETNFYTCQSFYTIDQVRDVFIVENDVKTGDTFSVGQKVNGVINDVGYRAGSKDGMRLVQYTLGAIAHINKQPERKTIEPVVDPEINNDNDKKEITLNKEPKKFLILSGVAGLLILTWFSLVFIKK